MQFRDSELEMEAEDESGMLGEGPLGEGPLGEGAQQEQFLGGILKGLGGMLGLGEGEEEAFGAYEFENPLGEGPLGEGPLGEGPLGEGPLGEGAQQEQFLGGLLQGAGSMLGLGEGEEEAFGAYESEDEQFFKGIRKFVQKAAPVLKQVARAAMPVVAGAVGGPVGMKIGKLAGQFLQEGEFEDEMEGEFESVGESPLHEGPLTAQQGLGELMAAIASKAQTDMEAEAMAGAATVITLSPADRAALKNVLASLVRGSAILTRILRRNRATRPAVRAVPTIIRRTAQTLQRRAASGRPVTKRAAARVMARQTQNVLGSPAACSHAVTRNVRATRAVTRSGRRSNGARRPYTV
ncbi:MAG TPA: hypothetical protein VF736_21795 [Pyrinomonadaceae bacterium]|jgi:hypothetical protein